MNNYLNYCCLIILLANFPLNAGLLVGTSQTLNEVDPDSSVVVDAALPPDRDTLLISKHGNPSEVLTYRIEDEEDSVVLEKRQTFKGFAPILFENRDFVFAFKPLSKQAGEQASLFVLDKTNKFLPFHVFEQDIKNIAATAQSNFLTTIDYAKIPDLPMMVPRLKLFNSLKTPSAGQRPLERQGNALSVIFQQSGKNVSSIITALAMSPLSRVKVGDNAYPANRVFALAHSSKTQHALNVWYFPSIDKDFNAGQGRISVPLVSAVDTIVFSPNTFGLMLLTNKALGKIWVLQFDLVRKNLTKISTLSLEAALGNKATHISASFFDNDEIIAGINQTLYLFKKNEQGDYARDDIQPVKDFAYLEYFAKILKKEESFIAVGTKGHLQMGKIE